MTISFMVLAAPRSATTWISNLLTTDHTICLHDPLLEYERHQLDQMTIPNKRVGIADSALLLHPDWLEKHPAKKILLWREPQEVNKALNVLGLREIEPGIHAKRIQALPRGVKQFYWATIFDHRIASEICRFFDVPFCRHRFEELKKMNVQPQFNRVPVGRAAAQDLVTRLAKELA